MTFPVHSSGCPTLSFLGAACSVQIAVRISQILTCLTYKRDFVSLLVSNNEDVRPESEIPLPFLLNHLCFGARFVQESRLISEVFLLAFSLRCVLLPWQWGWLKTKLK